MHRKSAAADIKACVPYSVRLVDHGEAFSTLLVEGWVTLVTFSDSSQPSCHLDGESFIGLLWLVVRHLEEQFFFG